MEKEFNKQWPVSRYSPVSEADAGEKQFTRDCEYDDDDYTSARDEYAREEVTVIDPSYSIVAIKQMNKMGFVAGHGLGATGTTADLAAKTGESMGSAALVGAQAQGAGQIGAAKAYGNTLQGIANYATLPSYMQQPTQTGYGTPAPQLNVSQA